MLEKLQRVASRWLGEALIFFMLGLTIKLTLWAEHFADHASVTDKADLTGAAAVIGAVAGIPIAMLTLLLNKYLDLRKDN